MTKINKIVPSQEPELLEPLMPAIRNCLEHRHSYVRRNAVLAIFTIYKNFDFLIPDAPEVGFYKSSLFTGNLHKIER